MRHHFLRAVAPQLVHFILFSPLPLRQPESTAVLTIIDMLITELRLQIYFQWKYSLLLFLPHCQFLSSSSSWYVCLPHIWLIHNLNCMITIDDHIFMKNTGSTPTSAKCKMKFQSVTKCDKNWKPDHPIWKFCVTRHKRHVKSFTIANVSLSPLLYVRSYST